MTTAVLVFSASAGFVVYVLAVYPLLLSLWAKARPKPIRKAPLRTRVSIVVPVRNGARWIEAKIRSVLETSYPGELIDVLIVSDGSTDGSDEIVSQYPDERVRLLALPAGGKAVAVNRGIESVSGEIVVLTDVRQTFDPDAIPRLLACFAEPGVGVVTGELVNRIDAMLGATGSIYAIRRELAPRIPADVLLDDVYVPFAVAFRGSRIYFEDKAKAYDLPTALQAEFWRKVRTQAGVYQILFHFPALLSPFNRRFIHFLSHKLGRLLLPFAMLAAALASFFLPDPWRAAALSLQGIFYGLALVDPFIPERSPIKRLSAVARAFVVLTAAAGCALAVFVLPARQLWKETRTRPAGQ
jgi:glycosyltransferase involved in cell wall biosynthesis